MHMPFAIVPPSVWFFAFLPVALVVAAACGGLALSVLAMVRAQAQAQARAMAEAAAATTTVRMVPVSVELAPAWAAMTGEIATLPEGGPDDSLAA
jgi:predicted permease